MAQLKLSQATGNGEYHTLAGAGIIIDLLHQAIEEVGANPSGVVLRFKDGNLGNRVDVMYPTPHTYLFDGFRIEDGCLVFTLGKSKWSYTENDYKITLADPDIASTLADLIRKRAKSHRETKRALSEK